MFNDAVSVSRVQAGGLRAGLARFELFQINKPEFCDGERPRPPESLAW